MHTFIGLWFYGCIGLIMLVLAYGIVATGESLFYQADRYIRRKLRRFNQRRFLKRLTRQASARHYG